MGCEPTTTRRTMATNGYLLNAGQARPGGGRFREEGRVPPPHPRHPDFWRMSQMVPTLSEMRLAFQNFLDIHTHTNYGNSGGWER